MKSLEGDLGPIENCLRRARVKKVSLSTGECRPISKRRPEAASQYPRLQREMLIVETGRESTILTAMNELQLHIKFVIVKFSKCIIWNFITNWNVSMILQ